VTAARPLDGVAWPVRSERLVLRAPTVEDAAATWRYRRLDSVAHWLTRAPRTLDEHRKVFEDPATFAKTVVIELDGEVIGDLMVSVEDGWAQVEVAAQAKAVHAELGWVLDPDHTGRGYATEAVREAIRICFEDLGLRRVRAGCFAENEASWRLMERVGMRRELHSVRESLHRSGQWLDGFEYALLADEWRGARDG
jgi:RimJ/RimL family protein N-acetyltransferase